MDEEVELAKQRAHPLFGKLPYEAYRVAQLSSILGSGNYDFSFDLHNTTANAGLMIIIRYERNRVLHVRLTPRSGKKNPYK